MKHVRISKTLNHGLFARLMLTQLFGWRFTGFKWVRQSNLRYHVTLEYTCVHENFEVTYYTHIAAGREYMTNYVRKYARPEFKDLLRLAWFYCRSRRCVSEA